jgi:hypothetical protein
MPVGSSGVERDDSVSLGVQQFPVIRVTDKPMAGRRFPNGMSLDDRLGPVHITTLARGYKDLNPP